jgi:hypothetical protein
LNDGTVPETAKRYNVLVYNGDFPRGYDWALSV